MKKRLFLFFALTLCLTINAFPISAFANQTEPLAVKDSIVSIEDDGQNYTIERTVKNNNVTVLIKDSSKKIVHTIKKVNGAIYVDEKIINATIVTEKPSFTTNPQLSEQLRAATSVKWGSWVANSSTFDTGGLTTVVISGIIVLECPWVPVQVAAIVAGSVAGMYEKVKVNSAIRYGTDSTYQYYERNTTFYGVNGNTSKKIYGPTTDKGKKPL
jgi:hypothetical protein